jgi:hypothetical protein
MADLAGRADLRGLPERPVGAHAVAPFDEEIDRAAGSDGHILIAGESAP